jgi:hypothetical protein
MKLFKNLFFVIALMTFGCKGAEDHSMKPKDHRWFSYFFKEGGVAVRDMADRRLHYIDQNHYNVLRDMGVVDENNLIRDNTEFRKLIARFKSIEMQERKADQAVVKRAAEEWKQARVDKLANDPIKADESTREAQEAEFQKLFKPLVSLKGNNKLYNKALNKAMREANERLVRFFPEARVAAEEERGELIEFTDSDQEEAEEEEEEEERYKTEQLIQDFDRADMAGTLPDAYYEELQNAGLMDAQRTVLNYEKLGEFLLQKSRNE